MHLKTLTKDQLSDLYNDRMREDFPPSELKPLFVILDAVDKGIYEALGLYDGEEIVGYFCLVKQGNDYLVDYLAIYPEKRNGGIGSILVKLLSEHMDSTGNIIGEVEDPKYARNDDDRKLRIRRMDFYLRNGCFDTGVRAKCFGVEFIILRMGKKKLEKQKCWDIYSAIYRSILPKDMYDENIELLGFTDDQPRDK
jgi:GNAT superfamily N-acetyltransferase